jgi:uncharacterized protein with von Willebrand factor type A (vWA) domain
VTSTSFDSPYDALSTLPRELWLGTLITACGHADERLRDVPIWLDAVLRGQLPPRAADMGDAEAGAALRRVIGELGLPTMAQGVRAAAHQVLRTALWHLDSLIDRPLHQPRNEAILAMVMAFRDEWSVMRAEWDPITALLRGMGELAMLSWDTLQGRLQGRDWARAQALSELVVTAPEIVALLARIGRGIERSHTVAPTVDPQASRPVRVPIVWRSVTLPDAPGQIHGVRYGANLARMVPAESAQMRHPVLHKLWRARLAESRLQIWDESAVLREAVPDPRGAQRVVNEDLSPRLHQRGPMIVCVDTSGSMKGAPEQLSKAVVLEAVRTAHREQRGCHLLAFGAASEVVEWTLGPDADGLDELFEFIGQAFDGGTDIATPIERAVERVNTAGWHQADMLIVSDGEFGATPAALQSLDKAREQHGLRVEGLLIGDRETMGLLEVCDHIHWVRDWRRFDPQGNPRERFSPVHSKSLTALYFPNALSARAAGRKS